MRKDEHENIYYRLACFCAPTMRRTGLAIRRASCDLGGKNTPLQQYGFDHRDRCTDMRAYSLAHALCGI